ncbi:MAG: twin-arginine translocase TatA/TatE family subunit [Coriobacteriia bacterium]|nr:twin-arginine translocase TatA/TatE family subunit [Coriobacteriia bacterium]
MFSLGGSELLLIAIFALVLFGPDKIPQMARTVGKFMREFNKYRDIMESTVRAEIYKDEWNKDAEKKDPDADLNKITQAADAVKDLVAEQQAKDAAAAAAAAADGLHVPEATAVPEPPRPTPSRATDEDEEDEV